MRALLSDSGLALGSRSTGLDNIAQQPGPDFM